MIDDYRVKIPKCVMVIDELIDSRHELNRFVLLDVTPPYRKTYAKDNRGFPIRTRAFKSI